MSQELNSISFSDFVRLAPMIWNKSFSDYLQKMRGSGLVKEVAIPMNSGNTREFSEIDDNLFLKYKAEGDQAERALIQQGYSKIMTAVRYGENLGITYEMRAHNKYPEVVQRLQTSGRKGAMRMDLDLTHRITFAAANSYADQDGRTITTTTGDGKALAYTAHELSGSTTTYRNILANNPRLSKGSLEGMERLIVEETYSTLGEKKTASFDILFTSDDPNTVNTAREYLQSTADVEGANSGVKNVYNSKYRHITLPWLATDAAGATDTDKRYYWGLASSENDVRPITLGVWEEPHLMPLSDNGEDAQTDDYEFRSRAEYGICTLNGTGLKLSKGDASA